ncbi:MAG: hypothetical protein ABIR26_00135, partial [Ramlibacter sp.]
HLPLAQAAAASGILASELLRQAADGRLALYVRLANDRGYVAPFSEFEVDDPQLGTRVIPNLSQMPHEGRRYVANGVYKVPGDEVKAVANHLLTDGTVEVVAFEAPEDSEGRSTHTSPCNPGGAQI